MGRRLCILASREFEARLIALVAESELGLEVRAWHSMDEALRAASECDILLFRDSGERGDGVRFVRDLTRRAPDLDVLVMTGAEAADPIEYFEAGAVAWAAPNASAAEALAGIQANEERLTHLDPATVRRLVRRVANLARVLNERGFEPERCGTLTAREREICERLERGESNPEIAEELGVAVGTVKSHLHNVYRKLDVDSRYVAAALWRIWCESGR